MKQTRTSNVIFLEGGSLANRNSLVTFLKAVSVGWWSGTSSTETKEIRSEAIYISRNQRFFTLHPVP